MLLLARTEAALVDEELPDGLSASALVVFEEEIRPDAAETLRYFAEQGVRCMVISGDNPHTVGAIARRVGVEGRGPARSMPGNCPTTSTSWLQFSTDASVFGRVSPQQKRGIVGALQSQGHVVAMTGDGVNDALALKDADIGIAMGSGAPATRAVAQVVLLDGRFANMPSVVAEGRRVIANVERVANLFVTKTVYAMLLAVAIGVARWPYPFLPRHLTIVSSLTIGIPAFFIALAPNSSRYVPGFVRRVLLIAGPAGVIAATSTFTAYAIAWHYEDLRPSADRGHDHVAHRGAVGVERAVPPDHSRPIDGVRRDGRRVRGDHGGAGLAPLVRAGGPDRRRAWGTIGAAAAGVAALEIGWQVRQWRRPVSERTPRWAWHGEQADVQAAPVPAPELQREV